MRAKDNQAFTVVELFAVLTIFVVLACLSLPALTRLQAESRQTQCANNLRQLGLAHLLYGIDNREILPTSTGGNWAWDISPAITGVFSRYGAGRQQFYCPAYPEQNVDGLWNYAIAGTPPYRVTGYALTLGGTASLIPSNANTTITPRQTVLGAIFLPPQPAATRVLVADANISLPGQNNTANKLTYNYSGIQGGSPTPHHSAHMDILGQYPSGANVIMLDGHTEWRSFSNAACKTTGGSPGFWW